MFIISLVLKEISIEDDRKKRESSGATKDSLGLQRDRHGTETN